MKRLITICITALLLSFQVIADTQTEKLMSKIRHSDKYLYGTARGATEEQAYDEALKMLVDNVTNYLQSNPHNMPDAVYIDGISSYSERLMTYTSSQRVNVMLYVEKSKLLSLDYRQGGGMIISRSESGGHYEPVDVTPSQPVEIRDTVVQVVEVPVAVNPVISRLNDLTKQNEIQPLLLSLKKDGKISGAALFPLSNINDYYLVIVNPVGVVAGVLHCKDGVYTDTRTVREVDINDYSHCSAYWVVLK